MHHLINDKIEAKTNEIIDKDDQKLTRDDLRNVYKEIVDGEQLNFVNQLKAEQDNLKRQLDIERTRFEDIIELKSKE